MVNFKASWPEEQELIHSLEKEHLGLRQHQACYSRSREGHKRNLFDKNIFYWKDPTVSTVNTYSYNKLARSATKRML